MAFHDRPVSSVFSGILAVSSSTDLSERNRAKEMFGFAHFAFCYTEILKLNLCYVTKRAPVVVLTLVHFVLLAFHDVQHGFW